MATASHVDVHVTSKKIPYQLIDTIYIIAQYQITEISDSDSNYVLTLIYL